MTKRFALDLVGNATDSLKHGLTHYDGERSSQSDLKAALLLVFHALELLLKERLARVNPALILADIDATWSDDARTVSFAKLPNRLSNVGVELDTGDRETLRRVSKHRNVVQHSHFDMSYSEVAGELGDALKLVFKFMESELELNPEEELTGPLFHKARELVHTYEELVRQAEESLKKVMPADPSERDQYVVLNCPECGHDFVDQEGKCHFCLKEFVVGACEVCGERTVDTFCARHGGGW